MFRQGKMGMRWLLLAVVAAFAAGCSLSQTVDEPVVVLVTATPQIAAAVPEVSSTAAATPVVVRPTVALSPTPANVVSVPTADPERFDRNTTALDSHVVQSGDTLYGIALKYGTTVETLLTLNILVDPNVLQVGETIVLPGLPEDQTPGIKLLPDARVVRGPGAATFDVTAFILDQPGYIRNVVDIVDTRRADGSIRKDLLSAAQVIDRVSVEYSVDARLLLALLEYHAGWLSNPEPDVALQEQPFDVARDGFYRQMAWVADQVNRGYYGWKARGWSVLEFPGVARYLYHPQINAGTAAIQYVLSLMLNTDDWLRAVGSVEGFYGLYFAYFGDPFLNVVDPLVPANLVQPDLTLPFASGETWFFTGGAHGGWGSGSAWAAIDFAPPDERIDGVFCFTSMHWVRAVATGLVVRSADGVVVLDLDMDGDEGTGWTILYLHLAAEGRSPLGTVLNVGDPVGRASCAGGFSTATHLHIARRYNGEWIPADCVQCSAQHSRPVMDLSGWEVVAIPGQEYQGFLERGAEQRQAEQGRTSLVNRING